MSERTQIELGLIDSNPYQPRMAEDPELVERLALSIGRDGLLQPPAARRVNGRYQLAFGHTRLAAFRWLVANNYGEDFARMPLELVDLNDEAMYRHAVTENLQRKDLTPIEEARAMKRAMEDFGYNSQQVGLLFGKNDATVRGKIRLLDLDADFQAKLAAGEMSEGAARKILAVQKVIRPADLEELKKDGPRTVDEIVSHEIDNAYGLGRRLNRMHSRWDTDEPKGGTDLWLLNWTFETPPFMVPDAKKWKKLWDGDEERNGRLVVDMAMEFARAITSNLPGLESTWQELYQINGEHWTDVLDFLKQLMSPPACTACDYHIKQDGSHYCALKACHDNKVQRWGWLELDRLSEQLGIPKYNRDRDGQEFIRLGSSYDHKQKKWWEEKHKGLRLMLKKASYRHDYTRSGTVMAVMTGTTARKTLQAERKRREQEKNRLDFNTRWQINQQRQDLSNEQVYRFVWDQAAALFGDVFKGLSLGVLDDLRTHCRAPKGYDFDTLSPQARAAYMLLYARYDDDLTTDPYRANTITPVQDAARHLQGVAKAWGVKLPGDWLDVAAGYEPEGLAELIAAVAVETDED
jgi:ParB/RepB/Spo0J family partition protein